MICTKCNVHFDCGNCRYSGMEQNIYIGQKGTDLLHVPECSNLPDKSLYEIFYSIREARKSGYTNNECSFCISCGE